MAECSKSCECSSKSNICGGEFGTGTNTICGTIVLPAIAWAGAGAGAGVGAGA